MTAILTLCVQAGVSTCSVATRRDTYPYHSLVAPPQPTKAPITLYQTITFSNTLSYTEKSDMKEVFEVISQPVTSDAY